MTQILRNDPMNMLLKKSLIFPLIVLMGSLFGCSSISEFDTNLDKENFSTYFAPGSVTVYEDETQLPESHRYIGLVEGESCKVKVNDAPANAHDARVDARTKTSKLNANAIIFTSCINIEESQCFDSMVCYGKAFVVDPQE